MKKHVKPSHFQTKQIAEKDTQKFARSLCLKEVAGLVMNAHTNTPSKYLYHQQPKMSLKLKYDFWSLL